MDIELPSEYDVIIIGTGLTESILAAALSRIGYGVLHLDHNEYYGGKWASFNFKAFRCFMENQKEIKSIENDGDHNILIDNNFIYDIEEEIRDEDNDNFKKIEEKWRTFNIDIMPKLLYAKGDMVDLLIKSDIAKYCEFRAVTQMLCFDDSGDKLLKVPCSRADIFSSQNLTMIEKRLMMKFIMFCAKTQPNDQEYEDLQFDEFLKRHNLTSKLLGFIRNTIAVSNEHTTTLQGLSTVKLFIESLGRYGNTAFLSTIFGSGEMPQYFCRMAAVFGAVYCLDRCASSIQCSEDDSGTKTCTGVKDTTGQALQFVLHLTCETSDLSTSNPFQSLIKLLYPDESVILWKVNFRISVAPPIEDTGYENVLSSCGFNSQLDYSEAIKQAKQLFIKICGENEDFLPKPPNTEDILNDDKDRNEENDTASTPKDEDNDTNLPSKDANEDNNTELLTKDSEKVANEDDNTALSSGDNEKDTNLDNNTALLSKDSEKDTNLDNNTALLTKYSEKVANEDDNTALLTKDSEKDTNLDNTALSSGDNTNLAPKDKNQD